jgi:predicted SnoaL-like aldol condensation-catalyzing enzyme
MSKYKDVAVKFLEMCASGRSREAFAQYASPSFRHHNPHFAGDAESLAAAMETNARQFPGKHLEVKRALEDGDTVAVHSFVRHTADEPGYALVHIFRFEQDRIVELWDIAMAVPADSPNQHGMF